MKFKLLYLILLIFLHSGLAAQDTIRYMQYNLLNYGNIESYCSATANPTELKDGWIRTIVDFVKPDIFACVEIGANASVIQHLRDEVLNVNGIQYWENTAMSNFAGSSIVNMVYYNAGKFGLKSQDVVITEPRDINIYTFYLKTQDLGSQQDTIFFHAIVAHLKAGNTGDDELDRAASTNTLMQYLSVAYQPGNFVISGDFNLYTSSEQAYINLLNWNFQAYRFFDPVNKPGNWNNNGSFAALHTQSTHTSGNGCPSTGGLDDRFDFILISDDIKNGHGGMMAIPESYHAVGQDGQHFNSAINAPPQNPAAPQNVIDALYGNSDHLPVVMDIRIEKTLGLDEQGSVNPWFTLSNPNTDQAILRFNALTGRQVQIRVFDLSGNEVLHQTSRIHADNQLLINLSSLEAGAYLVQTESSGLPPATRKLIKL